MSIDIYSFKLSAPCRAVLLTAKQLGIEYNVKPINTGKDEQYAPEFIKLNPIHSIPTIVDNDFVLWESRAIMQYLCNQYAPNGTLYPSDPKKRAIVDRWLNFDVSLRTQIKQGFMLKLFLDIEPPEDKINALKNSLKFMNDMIGDNKYITGQHLTIADLTILANSWILTSNGYDLIDLPNFKRWITNLQTEITCFKEIFLTTTKEEIDDWAQNKQYLKRMLNN